MDVDIRIDEEAWRDCPALEQTVRGAVAAAAAVLGADTGEISVLLTGDSAMRALNLGFRGKDSATNVLSFPQNRGAGGALIGDIALGHESVAREAEAAHIPVDHHLAHLVIHGMLHLFGHDHEDDDDAEAMEALERAALARLAIPDPYAHSPDGP